MNGIISLILLPILAGIIVLFIPNRIKFLKEAFSLLVSGIVLALGIRIFISKPLSFIIGKTHIIQIDNLSGFIVLFIGVFGFLTVLYSLRFMKDKSSLNQYYGYILMTIGSAIAVVSANDLVFFITFWGFLGITLYLLIGLGGPEANYASKKTLVIVGGADALMVLGIAILWHLTKTFSMKDISVGLNSGLAVLSFITLASGAFAKAGAIPLHTWIPESSEVAPLPVMAFLPASLDKLLGIYFLARLSLDLFVVKVNSFISIFLLAIGAITVMAAVMMALVQHNLKRLLSYHAVSQVGYMVLGIGTGNPLGIAGGLFHMLNNAIYKTCLFLCSGAVEKKKGTTELGDLGGLSKAMPITYISCLVAALAISGIPPLNGFVSKWMVYQGLIELGESGSKLWVVWLIFAIFGSALTLASFMKVIHSVFLGQGATGSNNTEKDEVSWTMWLPMIVLAGICIIFGIFTYQIPIRLFIQPSVAGNIVYPGIWNASLSTGLILIGILIGLIFYYFGNIWRLRVDESFIGGEVVREDMRVSGVEFYKTIEEIPLFAQVYKWAKRGYFDVYDQGRRVTFLFTKFLRLLHNGVLPTYLAWGLLGAIVAFFVLR